MSFFEDDVSRRLSAYQQEIADLDCDRFEIVKSRDALILGAHAEGVTVADIARVTGLTRTMLYKIIGKPA